MEHKDAPGRRRIYTPFVITSSGLPFPLVREGSFHTFGGDEQVNRLGIRQKMYHDLYNANLAGGYSGNAIIAIDIALWDIAVKDSGKDNE